MKHGSRAERPLTIAGMVLSQVGLFLLTVSLVAGFYSGSWELVVTWETAACWVAWALGGIVLVFAGPKTYVTGMVQAGGGILGVIASLVFKAPAPPVYVMEIAAGIFCVGSYVVNFARYIPERVRVACNVANVIFIMVCITVLVNVINFYSYRRLDWTATKFYDLSETTEKMLASLEENLRITVFIRPRVAEGQMQVANPIHSYVKELLQRFRAMNPERISVEWIDPDWDRKRADELFDKYSVSPMEAQKTFGVIVLEYGSLHKYITSRDLADFEVLQDPTGRMPPIRRLRTFTGEAGVISALKGLMRGEKTVVYFVTDHGAKDITESNPKKGGLPTLKTLLNRENYGTKKLENLITNGVPDDCDVLVFAGPLRPLEPQELKVIDIAFRKGVNLLFMLDPLLPRTGNTFSSSGMEAFFERYGVRLHRDMATLKVRLSGNLARLERVPCSAKGCTHKIIDELREKRIGFWLDAPRSLEIVDGEMRKAGFQAATLLRTPSKFWGETNLGSMRAGDDEKGADDHAGPLMVGAAIHQLKPPATQGAEPEVVPRVVVFGDSDFIREDRLGDAGNLDLFMNSLYWLSTRPGEQEIIGIAPAEPERVKFEIGMDKLDYIVWPIVYGLPALVLLLGGVVWWFRRK